MINPEGRSPSWLENSRMFCWRRQDASKQEPLRAFLIEAAPRRLEREQQLTERRVGAWSMLSLASVSVISRGAFWVVPHVSVQGANGWLCRAPRAACIAFLIRTHSRAHSKRILAKVSK